MASAGQWAALAASAAAVAGALLLIIRAALRATWAVISEWQALRAAITDLTETLGDVSVALARHLADHRRRAS